MMEIGGIIASVLVVSGLSVMAVFMGFTLYYDIWGKRNMKKRICEGVNAAINGESTPLEEVMKKMGWKYSDLNSGDRYNIGGKQFQYNGIRWVDVDDLKLEQRRGSPDPLNWPPKYEG